MKLGNVHYSVAGRFIRGLMVALAISSISSSGLSQPAVSKPALTIRLERQNSVGVRPANVQDLSDKELSRLREALSQDLGKVFTIGPPTDGVGRGELDVSILKVTTPPQVLYVASCAIIGVKEHSGLLLAHDALIQSSIKRLAEEIVSLMSTADVRSQLLTATSPGF